LAAELTWVIMSIKTKDSYSWDEVIQIIIIILSYMLLRMGLGIMFMFSRNRRLENVEPSILLVGGLILKPAFIYFIISTTSLGSMIKI
ncbi:MAG: hypothetical protein ABJZ91_05610, partial [Cyclobacteriaceae bacterium]